MQDHNIQHEVSLGFNYQLVVADAASIVLMVRDRINYKKITEFYELIRQNYWCDFLKNPEFLERYSDTLKVQQYHNLVPNILRYSFALLLSGTTVTPTFKANYIALGSDSTPPDNEDTTLGTETIRDIFTNKYAIDNIAYLDKFRTNAQVGGNTYLEAGIFVDGTATTDTGYLLSHVAINQAVGVNETLTINASFTIT